MNYRLVIILILGVTISIIFTGCSTIEPMVKNDYDTVRNVNLNKTEPIEKIAILVEVSNWTEKDVLSGVYKKSNEEREKDKSVAEVAFKGAIKKVLKMKGYECIYVDGKLPQAYEKAFNDECQVLLYAKFKWIKGRLYYDQENWGTYTKIWYAESVPMANGYFDIRDVNKKGSIFMVKYNGHSDVTGEKQYGQRIFGHEMLSGEKEIPYVYRIVEQSLKEFPTIDKFIRGK